MPAGARCPIPYPNRIPTSAAPAHVGRCEAPDARAVSVRLEPGLAFGTGEHSTTRLCLRWLAVQRAELARGARVMDYGTGAAPRPRARARSGTGLTSLDPLTGFVSQGRVVLQAHMQAL